MDPVFAVGNEMIITAAPPEGAGAASAISAAAATLPAPLADVVRVSPRAAFTTTSSTPALSAFAAAVTSESMVHLRP